MKIGFYTSTFNDRPLEEVADFAASAGFDAIEIDVGGHIKTPDRVADAVAPVLGDLGLVLHDVEHAGTSIRVVIDRDGGVDVDALTSATRAVSRLLDDLDPIDGHYTLEVSSPGLERPLMAYRQITGPVGETALPVGAEVGLSWLPGTARLLEDEPMREDAA